VDLELRDLRIVEAITKEGGLTRAAARLNISQPALTYQLRAAEQRVGTDIFRRVGRRLVITPAGERLLRLARLVADEMAHAEEDIRTHATTYVLRLSTECHTCYHWLPARTRELRDAFPGVTVKIVLEATRQPLPALLEGSLDLAIVASPVRHPRLAYRALFEDDLVVIVHPDHRLATRRWARPEDLRDEVFLSYLGNENAVLNRLLRPAGAIPREVHSVPLTEAIVEMVKAGMGVGVLARWAVAPQVEEGSLRALPLTSRGFKRRWGAAFARSRRGEPHLEAFVALLARSPMVAASAASR
jgi:LysR family transcriptional regulator for metE and metH